MRFLTLTLAVALTFSALAQPVCAPLGMMFDLSPADGSTPEEVYFWVQPLNGWALISADGVVDVPAGGTLTTETQVCLYAGCYFFGLETEADWWPSVDVVTDDLMWSVSEPEPMYEQNDLVGFTFCVENNFAGCIDESLIDPNMACTEEWDPVCGCDGVTYSNSCYATHVGGVTSFEEGECGSDPCIDETLIDPDMPCIEIWSPVCGCDGVTYVNSCEAENLGGVLWYTAGECGQPIPCEPVIEAWPSEVAGVWNFLVYDVSNPWADPFSEDDLEWDGNGEVAGEGPNGSTQIAFWGTNDFLFVACANVWCGEEWVEVCWETANDSQATGECESASIMLNAQWGSAAGADPLELQLVLSMVDADLEMDLGVELEGGSASESWSLFCLPIGHCFELEAEIEDGDVDDIDVLDIAVVLGQELPVWQDVLEVLTADEEESWTTTFGVDVTEECGEEEPDAVVDLATPQIAAMPNPAQGWVQFTGWTEGTATVVLRNALGQTLGTFPNIMPNQPLKLSPQWSGVVFAEIRGAGWTSRPVLVVR